MTSPNRSRGVTLAVLLTACGGTQAPPTPSTAAGSGATTIPTAAAGSGAGSAVAPAKADAPAVVDPALITCKTAGAQPPPGVCGILEKAPRADAASVKRTIEIWKRLDGPFSALSGRESALVVLAPEAKTSDGPDGVPIPPAAYICPGAPPTVYVPATLLALVDAKDPKKYPEDFLAFVIGHELGHRMNDLTPDGCVLAAFQRPGKGFEEEELADARSAFFMTAAGFSAGKIARGDMVSRFLEAEYALGREDSKARKDALLGALSKFDSYEALYQAALSVALSGDFEASDRLLTWADELVQSHGVLLPEIRVVRAITRINRAVKMAPWLGAEVGVPVGIHQLRCTPVHPGHSGLYEEPEKAVRNPELERGRELLKQALALLDEAEARGATPFTVAAARSCAHLYLADAAAAADAQARAESLLPAKAPASVKQTIAANRALVTFLQFVRAKKPPALAEDDALSKWTDELEATLGAAKAQPGLAAVIAALRSPSHKEQPLAGGATPACTGKTPTPAPFDPVPKMDAHGVCPAGYTLKHALPSLDAAKATGTTQGVTVCGRAAGDFELVGVRLAATTSPALEKFERRMLARSVGPMYDKLEAWACHCGTLERQGVSDRGETVYLAQCADLKIDSAVLVVVDGKVRTAIQLAR